MKAVSGILTLCLLVLSMHQLMAQNNLPNQGFETLNDTLPQGWIVDDIGAGLSDAYSHTGTYSLAVWNWYYYAKGWAVNGDATGINGIWSYGKAGTPIDHKADKLTGYYMYDTTHNGGNLDTAYVAVLFKRYNTALQKMDTVAFGEQFLLSTDMNGGMQPFELTITDLMPGVEPDSVAVYLQSSLNGFCSTALGGNCLYLYVDDLALETSTGTEDITNWFQHIEAYPNPASDQLTIESNLAADLNIYSLEGKLIRQEKVTPGTLSLDISDLTTGVYLLAFVNNGEVLKRDKLVVE